MVCGLCASCPIHSCYFAMHLPNPAERLAIQQQHGYTQEHVPVDPASSASIQIPHDVVRIACHWLWKLLKKIGQIPFLRLRQSSNRLRLCGCRTSTGAAPRGHGSHVSGDVAHLVVGRFGKSLGKYWKMWSAIPPPESA